MRSTIGLISAAVWMLSVTGCERREQPREQTRPEQAQPTEQQPAQPARPAEPGAAPATGQGQGVTAPAGVKEEMKALELELDAFEGSEIEVEAKLTPGDDGVSVMLEVDDAPPGALRAVIHEKGDCSNAAATSFGEPMMIAGTDVAPIGDLGAIFANKAGEGKLEKKLAGTKLDKNGPSSLIGRSIVIHQSDKSGRTSKDFGKPLACVRITRGE
jgi:Cu/Zn superoxide dismutase